ncbi:uncharacterized protein [Watersipora subatra]|uniref:uncharacterized protein n=1 Tax=Watersipora subatra TaxID=2589382 RepID=UPI00355B2CB0
MADRGANNQADRGKILNKDATPPNYEQSKKYDPCTSSNSGHQTSSHPGQHASPYPTQYASPNPRQQASPYPGQQTPLHPGQQPSPYLGQQASQYSAQQNQHTRSQHNIYPRQPTTFHPAEQQVIYSEVQTMLYNGPESTDYSAPKVASRAPITTEEPDPHLAWSIVNCVCCCWFLGLAAIIMSALAIKESTRGNLEKAWGYSNFAYKLNIASTIIGITLIIIVVAVNLSGLY